LKRAIPFGIFFLCSLSYAQEQQLATLARTLIPLRDQSSTRGGIPELTVVKHQVRDWVESRLASFPEKGDEVNLSNDLQTAMGDAKLFCDDPTDCVPTPIGYLDQILVSRERGFLIVTTAVGTGIRCGYDLSSYVYEWKANKWQRFWESEQNDYKEGAYHPQTVHAVHVSDAAPDGTRLILTLGTPPGCNGAFIPLYYRVWRAGGQDSTLILDKSELINDETEPPVIGRVTPDDLLIEFASEGTGFGFTHKALRHYEIHGTTATQTDPIAPTARDFVEEWLNAPWTESATRAESAALKDWYEKLHRDDGQGDYPDPAVGCKDPTLVEIATHFEEAPKRYFLVRTKEPLHFTMVNISDQPFSDCTRPNPDADKQPTLLPANQ
jgi:hypothetical protein